MMLLKFNEIRTRYVTGVRNQPSYNERYTTPVWINPDEVLFVGCVEEVERAAHSMTVTTGPEAQSVVHMTGPEVFFELEETVDDVVRRLTGDHMLIDDEELPR